MLENINNADPVYYGCFKGGKEEWIESLNDIESSAKISNLKELVKIIALL